MQGRSAVAAKPREQELEAVRQYSLREILAVWAAAAVPMGVLAWVVAPWLADQLGGDQPLTQALLILLTAGLIWQFVLVLILLRRELGSLEWPRVRDALWLRAPRDPKTGRVGRKVWWWALLFVALVAVWAMVPAIPGPSARDFGDFIGADRAEDGSRARQQQPPEEQLLAEHGVEHGKHDDGGGSRARGWGSSCTRCRASS
jgi:hypothetical protein